MPQNGPSPKFQVSVLMHSIPGTYEKSYGYHIPGTLQTRQFDTLLLVHQFLKWSGPTVLDSLVTKLVQNPVEDHLGIMAAVL